MQGVTLRRPMLLPFQQYLSSHHGTVGGGGWPASKPTLAAGPRTGTGTGVTVVVDLPRSDVMTPHTCFTLFD